MDKDGWFFDQQGNRRFRITDFIQPNHPIIKELAKGKTAIQISNYWRDEYSYDDNPPFRLMVMRNSWSYVLDCPDNFTPSTLIDYIFHAKKADCWGGSCFVTSMLRSQGYPADVVLGDIVRISDESRSAHAWVEVKIPPEAEPVAVKVFEGKETREKEFPARD